MVTVHIDPLAIAAPYMALSGLVGLLVGLLGGYWFGRVRVRSEAAAADVNGPTTTGERTPWQQNV